MDRWELWSDYDNLSRRNSLIRRNSRGAPDNVGAPIRSRMYFANEWALRTARVTKIQVATRDKEKS